MATPMRRLASAFACALALWVPAQEALALPGAGDANKMGSSVAQATVGEIGIDQKIDAQLPLDAQFRDEKGNAVTLGQYFTPGKPVMMTLIYNDCPMLCNLVLNGITNAMKFLSLQPGKDFEFLAISINPNEKPGRAAEVMGKYLKHFGANTDSPAAKGWHFLTGDEANIQRVASAVGFRYAYDPEVKEYAHASMVAVATPAGHVARYFYGTEFAPRDLTFAMVEASSGRVGKLTDQLLLLCYRYDPASGTYSASIIKTIRLGAVLTLAAVALFMVLSLRKERRGRRPGVGLLSVGVKEVQS